MDTTSSETRETDEFSPGSAGHAPGVRRGRSWDWRGYAHAVAVNAAATAVGWVVNHRLGLDHTNVLMLYLLGVLWVASRHSRSAAVLASVLAVAAFDFCFVPPHLTFAVADQQYLVTFAVMLLTALTISSLTHRVREQARAARQRERRTESLLALSQALAAARTDAEIVAATVRHVSEVFGAPVRVLLAQGGDQLAAKGDDDVRLPLNPEVTAGSTFDRGRTVGRGRVDGPSVRGAHFPMMTPSGPAGVLAIFLDAPVSDWPSEQRQLAAAFASQVAMALERAALAEEARRAWERVETEFLRNTLLSGVSHDLRTPLAAITGAVSSLIETAESLAPDARAEMLDTIRSESDRMERLINNLLDMTRLESGGLVLRKEWHSLHEVVGAALRHLDRRLDGREVRTDLPADLPLVRMDDVAVEQVLVNLLDNVAAHVPDATPIEISARVAGGDLIVEVADRGPGLPPGAEHRVFEKFFRAGPGGGGTRRGIGLGLAICRGLVEAHGGTICGTNRAGGGTVFRFTLPCTAAPPVVAPSHDPGIAPTLIP